MSRRRPCRLSQATEAGTIYQPHQIRELADIAHARGLAVHVDGARLGNALARMNVSPDEATWKSGVDVLSFGATKGGAMAAEAIVFFDPARGADMARRRKRGGHLLSKHRFIAAQMDAFLADDLWLNLARHANAMADRLSDGLAAAGFPPVWPVEANEVFAILPKVTCERLRAAGAAFYERTKDGLPKNRPVGSGDVSRAARDIVCHLDARSRPIRRHRQSKVKTACPQVSIDRLAADQPRALAQATIEPVAGEPGILSRQRQDQLAAA